MHFSTLVPEGGDEHGRCNTYRSLANGFENLVSGSKLSKSNREEQLGGLKAYRGISDDLDESPVVLFQGRGN
jgi:hypothetical protein